MRFSYALLEKAQEEYETSLLWYLERSTQAAEKFIDSFNECIELVCNDPTRWRKTHKEFYELNLKHFPFTLVYIIEDNKNLVLIVSLHHHSRNPKKKYRKK